MRRVIRRARERKSDMKATAVNEKRAGLGSRLLRDLKMNKLLWVMSIPLVAFYFIFHYMPMYGILIAFKDFKIFKGFAASPWVGFKHFESFFNGIYFGRTFSNTLIISLLQLAIGFPIPIIFALMMNELRSDRYRRVIQTVTYMPHFISLVVFCGMIVSFFSRDGLVNDLLALIGVPRHSYITDPGAYRALYVGSGIWKNMGWSSIIYMAAISRVDQELYEACTIDGGNRWTKLCHVTLPQIMPTVVTLFILTVGRVMGEGAQKTVLLYNSATMEKADIISSYVYRRGIENAEYSFSTAVDLFNNVINCALVLSTNKLSRKIADISLW